MAQGGRVVYNFSSFIYLSIGGVVDLLLYYHSSALCISENYISASVVLLVTLEVFILYWYLGSPS